MQDNAPTVWRASCCTPPLIAEVNEYGHVVLRNSEVDFLLWPIELSPSLGHPKCIFNGLATRGLTVLGEIPVRQPDAEGFRAYRQMFEVMGTLVCVGDGYGGKSFVIGRVPENRFFSMIRASSVA